RRQRDARGGDGVARRGHAGRVRCGVVDAPRELVDNLDFNRVLGAGVDTGGLQPFAEPSLAHVAFADDAAFGVELRNGVRAIPYAVLAADARIRRVQHDPGHRIFCVSFDGAAFYAVGVEAVVAAHGEVVAHGVGIGAAFEFADTPPVDVGGVAVLLVAGDLAGAAADALGHVEVEAVLLTFFQFTFGYQGLDHTRRRTGFEQRHAHEIEAVAVDGGVVKWQGQVWPFAIRFEKSVDVAVVAVLLLELLHKLFGRFLIFVAVLLDQGVKRGVDILCHAGSVAADVDGSAVVKPPPELCAVLDHAVLNVDLVG